MAKARKFEPYWRKLANNPDYDVKVSSDETHVDILYKKIVPLAALKKALDNA